ncbi:MAG TPA: type II toxin-antitoxin system Phd/YefM family antitoxin [Candidatus Polarisedimenticolaceae bacterium]|nr:type II toxin-antitoxin system Phd/YefM family antitoxin [Candidatus Polarisedimenticolaceae bacterium]
MPKIPTIIPLTDLEQDAAGVLRRLGESKQPVVLTQRGRAAVVLLSLEEYERGEHERQLLRLIARGERDTTAARGLDLDSVLAEADAILGGSTE